MIIDSAMHNYFKKQDVQDELKINVTERLELDNWASKLNVPHAKLIEAVYHAGPILKNVRQWLQNHGLIAITT